MIMRLGMPTEDLNKKSSTQPLILSREADLKTKSKTIVFGPVTERLGFKTEVLEKPPIIMIHRQEHVRPIVKYWSNVKVFQKDERWIAYYGSVGSSFGIITDQHTRLLPMTGWTFRYELARGSRMLHSWGKQDDSWSLVHPIFHVFRGRSVIPMMRGVHRHLGGFDVADTDMISSSAVRTANKMDLIMVPSEFSKQAYVNSGVKTRVEVVPHGVNEELYSQPKSPSSLVPGDGVKILFFFWHSELRKGADVVREVMKRIH